VTGCGECGDEPSGSCATELVISACSCEHGSEAVGCINGGRFFSS
jgi:hypothetical protein